MGACCGVFSRCAPCELTTEMLLHLPSEEAARVSLPSSVSSVDPEEECWEYMDVDDTKRGPFSGATMDVWHMHCMFPDFLRVRHSPTMPFVPIGELFSSGQVAFCSRPQLLTMTQRTAQQTATLKILSRSLPVSVPAKESAILVSNGRAEHSDVARDDLSQDRSRRQRANARGSQRSERRLRRRSATGVSSPSCLAGVAPGVRTLVLFHGTSASAARSICSVGFLPSKGLLGHGIYFTSSKQKAAMYGPELLECVVTLVHTVIVRAKDEPLRLTWREHGYDSALMPANCGMVKCSPADVYCIHDARCAQVVNRFNVRDCSANRQCKEKFCRECKEHSHLRSK